MRTRHKIDYDDVKDFDFSATIASSFGKGENKRLAGVVTNGLLDYVVTDNGENCYVGKSLKDAIIAYNDIL